MREELLHPAASHFPIALLVLLMFTKTAQFFVTEKYSELKKNLQVISKFLLVTGTCFLLPAIFLGDMALDIVKNHLCEITAAYEHEEYAKITLIIFIIAIVLDTLPLVPQVPTKLKRPLNVALLMTIFIGNFYLFETAEHGAELVYEQGAGVKGHIPRCDNSPISTERLLDQSI